MASIINGLTEAKSILNGIDEAHGNAEDSFAAPVQTNVLGTLPQPGNQSNMLFGIQKPKAQIYDFHYEDEDMLMKEINESYSYAENAQLADNMKCWEGSFDGDWTQASHEKRVAHLNILLEGLEHKDIEIRYYSCKRILYLAQGIYGETSSTEEQIHWMIENCKMIWDINGIGTILMAIKLSSSKHDLLGALSDEEMQRLEINPEEKAECMEDVNSELFMYYSIFYHLIMSLKSYEGFADELMSFDPPVPIFFFSLLAGLREKSVKNYPVKKLLLLTWKSLLACFGGLKDIPRVKAIARELHKLPVDREEFPIKASPFDIQSFREDTSVKYPTFIPDESKWQASCGNTAAGPTVSGPSLPTPEKLAQVFAPIPIRPHYHHGDEQDFHPPGGVSQQGAAVPPVGYISLGNNPHYNPTPVPQPLTPAPTPPPNPKPKKQQYQTDQTRPFLFPFTRSTRYNDPGRLVPFAVDEADKLYNKHMRVSLSLLQMWRTREDCMIAESGLQRATMDGLTDTLESAVSLGVKKSGVEPPEEDTSLAAEEHQDMEQVKMMLEETEARLREAVKRGETREVNSLKQRKEDIIRLKRVEQLYSAALPILPALSAALVKLLMATLHANMPNVVPPSASGTTFPMLNSPEQPPPPPPPPTIEEMDIMRHREITNEAVSAIVLLLLKWFKVSHVMKHHYFGQLLLDTNCLLLIMKMFILQDLAVHVQSRAESPKDGFFRFCQAHHSKNSGSINEEEEMFMDRMIESSKRKVQVIKNDKEEDVEILTGYSWRNFFSGINFLKIMQKLSKGRSHRIWLLVQFKSTVVLKRMIKIPQSTLQMQVLKLIKSQVPYCGRKWRTTNMKVITSIYLKLRPDLRDEWLTQVEVDDVADALAQEQALRKLVKFYNSSRYGSIAAHAAAQHNRHGRSSSIAEAPLVGMQAPPETLALLRPIGTPNIVEADVFPPLRAQASDRSNFLPYMAEDLAFEEEYEDYISDLGLGLSAAHDDDPGAHPAGTDADAPLFGGMSVWRHPHFRVPEMGDGIMSDSESIGSIDFGDDAKLDVSLADNDRDAVDENRNNWEHMSPKTMAALPKSPVGAHRRSSSGSSLRPVIPPFGLDDGSAVDLDDDEIDEAELGPVPRESNGPFPGSAGVDEVEYAYGL